jgi:hypothetical protein
MKSRRLESIFYVYFLVCGSESYQIPQNKRKTLWEQRFVELEQYKRKHGNANVPQNYKRNTPLGRWVRRQRLYYGAIIEEEDALEHSDDLTTYRIQKLMDVDFSFHLRLDVWSQRLQELKEFIEIHGHSRVPIQDGSKWSKLGLWVRNQRTMYNRMMNKATSDNDLGESDTEMYNFLTEERIELLNSLEGFSWDVQEDIWMEQYEKLAHFKEKFGHSDVQSRYKDEPSLSRWVQHQRRSKDSMGKERLRLLDKLDFVWGDKNEMNWWENYDALCQFKEKFCTCIVPKTYHDRKLYNWANNTRRKCRQFSEIISSKEQILSSECDSVVPGLDSERIEALRKIDFCVLPEIGKDGTISARTQENDARRSNKRSSSRSSKAVQRKTQLLQKRPNPAIGKKESVPLITPPKKENGAFVPFPWDEI